MKLTIVSLTDLIWFSHNCKTLQRNVSVVGLTVYLYQLLMFIGMFTVYN